MSTILVIDDEVYICQLIKEILEFEGMDTITAANGQDGLAMAIDEEPDLILCDVTMPGLNGFAVLEGVRSHDSLAHTPFIFLTGHTDRASMRKGMELGADDYITKPFRADEILSAIQARLQRQRKLRALQQGGDASASILNVLPHELNTPLQKILGFSDILREDVQDLRPEDISRTADLIHRSALRLHRLTENFLSFAQLERLAHDPQMTRKLKQVVLPHIKTLIAQAAQSRAQQHGRSDDLALLVEDDAVHINETHLVQIVEELVDNACKFSEPGSKVEVVGEVMDDDCYILQVKDRGRGMSQEAIQQIGAFRQFDRHLYEQQGVGLGLALAVRLADLHGGKIRIRSTKDDGTQMSVILRRQH